MAEYQIIDFGSPDPRAACTPFKAEFLKNSQLVIVDKDAADIALPHQEQGVQVNSIQLERSKKPRARAKDFNGSTDVSESKQGEDKSKGEGTLKRGASNPDLIESILKKDKASENLLRDIIQTAETEAGGSNADFREIDRLMQMDDILFETQEQFLLDSILDFVDSAELSAEQIIFNQIYPSLSQLSNPRSATSESESEHEGRRFISIDKTNFLQNVKEFLYRFCTTGFFYAPSDTADQKMTILKIIHSFKEQVEQLQKEQKQLKTKTINDIQSKNALQRITKTNMKNDFSRQTIESSPQVNASRNPLS